MSPETRTCKNCAGQFSVEPDDISFYVKLEVPPPTWCPECRMRRRFSWRNDRHLFRRLNDRTGEPMFSSYPPAVPAKIWDLDFWNSDGWDPMEYGRDYDLGRPFFEQFRELLYSVPWPGKSVQRMVNSEYCDQAGSCRNAYLCFAGDQMEDSAYLLNATNVKSGVDLYEARHTELSYWSYMADECYRVFFSVNVEECTDVWFSRNMIGCTNCFGCVNLRNKSYYIFNEPYSKEAYAEFMAQLDLGSYRTIEDLKARAREAWLRYPMRFALVIRCVNSTGEHIEHSKNLKDCYSIHEGENLAYSQFLSAPVSDSYDYTVWGQSSSEMYEAVVSGEECSRVRFSWECWPANRDTEYSAFCRSSEDIFGCVGLKKKKYCILNKQYSEEEFKDLRKKIIAQMNEMPYRDSLGREYRYGEFLPPDMSPYAYNETVNNDFFPLSPDEAKKAGYEWREEEIKDYGPTVKALDLPDNIRDVSDDILKEIVACAGCPRAYRFIPMELQFYRHLNLPLPRLCPECRFRDRFQFVNPPKFRRAACQCAGENDDSTVYKNSVPHAHDKEHCGVNFDTSYAAQRKEILYCEACYQAEST